MRIGILSSVRMAPIECSGAADGSLMYDRVKKCVREFTGPKVDITLDSISERDLKFDVSDWLEFAEALRQEFDMPGLFPELKMHEDWPPHPTVYYLPKRNTTVRDVVNYVRKFSAIK